MAELNLSDGQMNGGGAAAETLVAVGHTSKRQRRPSVRLGDIGGDQQLGYENHHHHHQRRASSKQHQQQHYQWKQHHGSGKASKAKINETLALALVDNNGSKKGVNDNGNEGEDIEGDLDLDRVAIGSWKSFRDASKSKRGRGSIRKRVRSNWVSPKIDENEKVLTSGGEVEGDGEEDFNLDNGINDTFGPENSEEEEEEEEEEDRNDSPIRSFENEKDVDMNRERGGVSGGGLKFDSKNRRRATGISDEMVGPSDSIERNGVKVWLNQLGLGRYAPVFEIHEVDDEVLPMLTLEDLKDMGINAVGSRRKMYCSIQKLNRGFS